VFVAACGDDEAKRLAALGEELKTLRTSLADTRARVAEREQKAKVANDELASARAAQRETELRIAELEKQIGAQATDPVVFRMVQEALLDDDELEDVAISARVERGVVTLSGVVSEAEQRERAVKLAEGVPGVVSVQDRITVNEGQKKS
jgi:osmotically-inducible protein OsmY